MVHSPHTTLFQKLAHSPKPLLHIGTKKDPLQDVIQAEKTLIESWGKLADDFHAAAKALEAWGIHEGGDLEHALTASETILSHFSFTVRQYASHGDGIRHHLKDVRGEEEQLDQIRQEKTSLSSHAEDAHKKLMKMSLGDGHAQAQKNTVDELNRKVDTVSAEIRLKEKELKDFKRTTIRTYMGEKVGWLQLCCENGVVAGEFAKSVILQIPKHASKGSTYDAAKAQSLVEKAKHRVDAIKLSVELRPSLQHKPYVASSARSSMKHTESTRPANIRSPGHPSDHSPKHMNHHQAADSSFKSEGAFTSSQDEEYSRDNARRKDKDRKSKSLGKDGAHHSGALRNAASQPSMRYSHSPAPPLPSPSHQKMTSSHGAARRSTYDDGGIARAPRPRQAHSRGDQDRVNDCGAMNQEGNHAPRHRSSDDDGHYSDGYSDEDRYDSGDDSRRDRNRK